MAVIWTSEKIAAKSDDEIKALLQNAIKLGASDTAALCEEELLKRAPAKKRTSRRIANVDRDEPVVGYHFVCRPKEKGVVRNPDGTAWSGTWVVAEAKAERSLQMGNAYVALHVSHAEPSYFHGIIRGVRRSEREKEYAEGQTVRTPIGTDFLLEITGQQLEWQGEGTVERSYVYASSLEEKQKN
jgi:hypothetical protein